VKEREIGRANHLEGDAMKVNDRPNEWVQYKYIDGHLVRIEGEDDECGFSYIVWGFLAAAVALLIVVIGLCL